ncbi:hypothetical protein SEY30_22290, partial [Escherichia coli]
MMTRAAMAALLSALVIGLVSDLAAQELVVSPVAIDKSTEVEKEATFHNRKWVLRTGQVSGFFICQGDNKDIYGTVAKLAMRQPFVLFKGLTFQKLCLPGAFRP